MPNDLAVSPAALSPKAANPDPTPPSTAPAAAIPVPASGPARPNPTLRLDSKLGLVVIELRDGRGDVTGSIPTSRQLEAYRRSQQAGGGAGVHYPETGPV